MSKPDKNSGIPLPLIILGYILSVPAGIVLTLLHLFFENKDKKDNTGNAEIKENKTEVTSEESEKASGKSEKQKKTKGSGRAGICVPALLLGILASIFLFVGILNAADLIFDISFQEFLREGLSETLMMILLSCACAIPAGVLKGRHDRQNVIRSIIGKRESIRLAQLAAASDLSARKLRKELQRMIDKGAFGEEAYIDMSAGMFFRHPDESSEAFFAQKTTSAEAGSRHTDSDTTESEDFRAIILQIRKLNDDIKDYAVSERIYRIEEHTQNIFDYVTAHPEAMPQIRSFMNYYLPTTLKLLDSYSRIEQVGVAGENMKKSKENIERILDMLVDGYKQQVDQLFRNESMDISSEIRVLEAMMKQDGLDGRNDFSPGFSDDLTGGSAAAQYRPETKE